MSPYNSLLFHVFESMYKECLKIPPFHVDSEDRQAIQERKQLPLFQSSLYKVIPTEIVKRYEHDKYMYRHYQYSFFVGSRSITLYISQRGDPSSLSDIISRIYNCLWFLNQVDETTKRNSSRIPSRCSKTLRIFLLLTPEVKQLPDTRGQPLQQIHCNTGFTYSCALANDIIIFREEEWCKVLIHECIHAFGFDFDGNQEDTNSILHSMYRGMDRRNQSLSINDAYTETWAQMIYHILTFIPRSTKNKPLSLLPVKKAYKKWLLKWNEECWWSCIQCSKILYHYGITYRDLVNHENRLTPKYREQYTSVFAYYILRPILMINIEEFLRLLSGGKVAKFSHSSFFLAEEGPTLKTMQPYHIMVTQTPYDPLPLLSFIQRHYKKETWIQLIDDTFRHELNSLPILFRKSLRMSIGS